MTAVGPTALPNQYIETTPARTLAAANHPQLHTDVQDELRALWTKLGLSASVPAAGAGALRATGAGVSAFGLIQSADIAANAVTQRTAPVAGSTNPTTTSGTAVALADPTRTLTTTGGDLEVFAVLMADSTVTNTIVTLFVKLDSGTFAAIASDVVVNNAGARVLMIGFALFTGVSAGSHTITLGWATNAGTATAYATGRFLYVKELIK